MGRRIVTAPDGERWRVRRRWLDRPAPRPWTRWRRSRKATDDGELRGGWLSDAALSGVDSLGGLGLLIGAVVVIAMIVFVLLPLIGIAFELALLIGFVLSGLFGRVALRRPWTIEAVSLDHPDRRSAFAVTGWRRSRRSLAALASAIEATGPPSALPEAEPALLDPAGSST